MPIQRVFVGNIPNSSRERDLERFFKGYGRINEVVVKAGYGFVEFDDVRSANGGRIGLLERNSVIPMTSVLLVSGFFKGVFGPFCNSSTRI